MTTQQAVREWQCHLCAFLTAAPGSAAYVDELATMNRLVREYNLKLVALEQLPDYPRIGATYRRHTEQTETTLEGTNADQ